MTIWLGLDRYPANWKGIFRTIGPQGKMSRIWRPKDTRTRKTNSSIWNLPKYRATTKI